MAGFSHANRRKYCRWLNAISCTDMATHNASLPRAHTHRPAGQWPNDEAAGSVTLHFDQRYRRRTRLTDDLGQDLLLDLPNAVPMADGDGLQLDDGRWLRVQAGA